MWQSLPRANTSGQTPRNCLTGLTDHSESSEHFVNYKLPAILDFRSSDVYTGVMRIALFQSDFLAADWQPSLFPRRVTCL